MIRQCIVLVVTLVVLGPLLSPLTAQEVDACAAIVDDRQSSSEVCGVEREESTPYATWWVRAHSRTQTFNGGKDSPEIL